ncbi:MAG: class I SAM-dependent methyltransferase [Thermoplasmata archaeon]
MGGPAPGPRRAGARSRSPGQGSWRSWVDSWDRQQTRYIPFREARFQAIGDALEARFGGAFTAVDLGCGPGSLSVRLLERFPRARLIAVAYDAVLLFLGEQSSRRGAGRLRWVEADLRLPTWVSRLPRARIDAAVSTTALHWLTRRRTQGLYTELAGRLSRRGLFLNGEHLPFDVRLPALARLAESAARLARHRYLESGPAPDWSTWWNRLRARPALASRFEVRARRYPGGEHHEHAIAPNDHVKWLRAAGFREAGVLWQHMDDFVIAGIR